MKPWLRSATQHLFRAIARLLARLLLRLTVRGTERVPLTGGLLVTMNHLGGADSVLALGFCPRILAVTGKVELTNWPVIGPVVRAYGMIALHREQVDRAALKQMLVVLAAEGALLIAPEGHESLTGALEAGKAGAAFLAQQAGVSILPVALTGTAWRLVLPAWRRAQRPCVTLTFGPPYQLASGLSREAAVAEIMRHLAAMLPAEYRGVYAGAVSPEETLA